MCTPSSTPNRNLHRTGVAPFWVALSISTAGHVRACLGPAPFRPQNCPFTYGDLESGIPCNTWFLGPTRIHIPNSISIGSAVFAGLTVVNVRPDWLTDRPRYSVCGNRPHLAGLRCGLIIAIQYIVRPTCTETLELLKSLELTKCLCYSDLRMVFLTMLYNEICQCFLAVPCDNNI